MGKYSGWYRGKKKMDKTKRAHTRMTGERSPEKKLSNAAAIAIA
jgi:hypothetical protein